MLSEKANPRCDKNPIELTAKVKICKERLTARFEQLYCLLKDSSDSAPKTEDRSLNGCKEQISRASIYNANLRQKMKFWINPKSWTTELHPF